MTTPEAADPTTGAPRVTRPEPERDGPNRSPDAVSSPAGEPVNLSEEVARAVKDGYDVIAENIKQGRIAASRFRQGEYNIREVPGDLEAVALRMLRLAREMSNTTFDVCERMLKEMGPAMSGGGRDRTQDLPAFRPTVTKTAAPPPSAAPVQTGLPITVRFPAGINAIAHTTSLSRPATPTAPEDIAISPLADRTGTSPAITPVTLTVDVSQGGLIAAVSPPSEQPPGVYSGLVHANSQAVPLGVLTIEILA